MREEALTFVAEHAAPVVITEAVPWRAMAGAMLAAGVWDTLVAVGTFPPMSTPMIQIKITTKFALRSHMNTTYLSSTEFG